MSWIGSKPAEDCRSDLNMHWNLTKMEIIVLIFPYGKTVAGIKHVWPRSLLKDFTAARARRKAPGPQPWSSSSLAMIDPNGDCRGYMVRGGDPCSFFQTQAAQTVLQSQEGPAMPRMAILLGFMGIGMSGYSSRQLTLHYKPSSHLFRWIRWRNQTHIPTPINYHQKVNLFSKYIPNYSFNSDRERPTYL